MKKSSESQIGSGIGIGSGIWIWIGIESESKNKSGFESLVGIECEFGNSGEYINLECMYYLLFIYVFLCHY